jgi:hypothetical protein
MSAERGTEIRVVVHGSGSPTFDTLETRVRLPRDAQFEDFIEALKAESPEVFEEVRRRVMRAAGRVLAYGRDDPLLVDIDRKLTEGGTLVFLAEDDASPIGEPLNRTQFVS